MEKKIIFLDYDRKFSESAVMAIKAARENEHKVCIYTAKPRCQVEQQLKEIGVDGLISSSGSYVEYEGVCTRHIYFTMMNYIALCNYLVENHCVVEFQRNDKCCILKRQQKEFAVLCENLKEKFGEEALKLLARPLLIESVMDMARAEKILFLSNRLPKEEFLERWGTNVCITTFQIPGTSKWGGEIVPVGVDKLAGIRSIVEYGAFEWEDVIAIDSGKIDLYGCMEHMGLL